MTSRWAARIALVIIIVLFFMLMASLQRRLIQMQRMRNTPPATSTH